MLSRFCELSPNLFSSRTPCSSKSYSREVLLPNLVFESQGLCSRGTALDENGWVPDCCSNSTWPLLTIFHIIPVLGCLIRANIISINTIEDTSSSVCTMSLNLKAFEPFDDTHFILLLIHIPWPVQVITIFRQVFPSLVTIGLLLYHWRHRSLLGVLHPHHSYWHRPVGTPTPSKGMYLAPNFKSLQHSGYNQTHRS